jgi:hypothetical protein
MREHADTHDDLHTPGARHETRDISTRVVVVFGVSLVVGAILVHFAVWLLYVLYGNMQSKAYPRQYPLAQVGPPPLPPAPRLQTQPREDLKNMRAEEERYLGTYGWADSARGAVHIPIDRAMELLLQQGLPARAQAPVGTSPGMPQSSSSGRTTTEYGRY